MRIVSTALALAFFAVAAHAQQGGAASQQQRSRDCNAQASQKNLTGDARQKFVNTCLKDEMAAQQQKTGSCSKRASDQRLRGEARKKFMSDCLRG
jgi:psiF repeat